MNGMMKQVSLWLVLLIIVVLAVTRFNDSGKDAEKLGELDFEPLLGLSEENPDAEGPVAELDGPVMITTAGNQYNVKATFKEPLESGQESIEFKTTEGSVEHLKSLMKLNQVSFEQKAENTILTSLLINILPLILIIGVFWFFMFRQMQGGSNKAMSFGKSRAKLANQSDKTATFADVAGVDEAKEELQEIIMFLRDPKKFTRLGGKIPRGVLLIGPPGSGKTLLARAVAGEAEVPFFSISGSDFVEMFVGVGASRVRDLFQQGHKHAPCIIFIDEIDAVGRQRGAGLGGGHDEREQTLNQLLVEMDGFDTNDGVILMAATNRPDVLDRALLRPGRFDRQVMVANPDIRGREAILDIHLRNQKVPTAEDVETKVLARATPGFSGADLANMVNEAALLAARRTQDLVTMIDFEDAKDRVMMGPARRSLVLSEKEKRNTAVHEAGHTLIGRLLPDGDPVHKATIIPRGPALGVTSFLPEEDRHGASKKYCLAVIRMSMGGRAAEEIIYNEYTSGCAGDLKHATRLAHSMVCEWGMSDLGPVAFGDQDEIFLGRDFSRQREFSDETAAAVDREVHRLLEEGYRDARQMLEEHENILRALAEALFEKETLDAEEIDDIIRNNGGGHLLPKREEKPKHPESKPPSQKPEPVSGEKDSDDGITDMPGDMVPGPA